jgi:SAM-dependent methyltransferase
VRSARSARRSRTGQLAWVGLAAGPVLDSLRLRGRLQSLPVLGDAPPATANATADDLDDLDGESSDRCDRVQGSGNGNGNGNGKVQRMLADLAPAAATATDEFTLVTVEGVVVDDATVRAAAHFARLHDADVVELVPADLPVAALLELLRRVDPAKFTVDRLHGGISAGHATLVRTGLLSELDVDPDGTLDPSEHILLANDLKRFAPTTCHLVLAPGLRARPTDPTWIVPRHQAMYKDSARFTVGVPLLGSAAMALAPLVGRRRGLPAYVAHVLLPVLVTAGTTANPSDLRPVPLLTRAVRDLARVFRAVTAKRPAVVAERAEEAAQVLADERAHYAGRVDDLSGYFEPRRETCPWCESAELRGLLDSPDLMQQKPGVFHLDECRDCHHIFQNPCLTIEGLDFYYGDFYDGVGGDSTAFMFAQQAGTYRDRAEMLSGHKEPERWLDVGCGHGHFCLVAREVWPETRFDGLDLSVSVVEASKRKWIDTAYQSLFPEMAPDLTGSYDVVSMHHYLEHTRDPRAELEAASIALESGGHLLIEVPDPSSWVGRLLGKYWVPWFQPQHQHFVQFENLCTELEDRGFTVVGSTRQEGHFSLDLAGAAWMALGRVAPSAPYPWLPEKGRIHKAWRDVVIAAGMPVLGVGYLIGQLFQPIYHRIPRTGYAYRVLARKD